MCANAFKFKWPLVIYHQNGTMDGRVLQPSMWAYIHVLYMCVLIYFKIKFIEPKILKLLFWRTFYIRVIFHFMLFFFGRTQFSSKYFFIFCYFCYPHIGSFRDVDQKISNFKLCHIVCNSFFFDKRPYLLACNDAI